MSTRTRWHPAVRVALTIVLGGLAWLAASWVLAPAPMCVVRGEVDASFTCPNRLGISLPTWLFMTLVVLSVIAVATTTWTATAPSEADAAPQPESPPEPEAPAAQP